VVDRRSNVGYYIDYGYIRYGYITMHHFSERLYGILLHLYPAEHRHAYGDLMAQAFRDLCKAAYRKRGAVGLIALWFYTLTDTVVAAFIEHRDLRRSKAMSISPVGYSRVHILVVLMPLLAIIVYLFAASDNNDTMLVYIIIFLSGAGIWILRRLGLLAANPIWTAYTAGTLLGASTMGLFMLSGAPALAIYHLELPPIVILVVSLLIYGVVINFSGRLTGDRVHTYRLMALLLAGVAIAAFLVSPTFVRPIDTVTRLVSLNYSLMQNLTILIATAIGIYGLRRWGQTALLTLLVALGVQFVWIDPGYFTGQARRWINLSTLLLPLVICPAWWLLAPNRRTQIRGTLVLWGVLMGITAAAPTLARLALDLDYETPGVWLYRVLAMIPFFAAVWFALWNVDRSATQSERTLENVPPETAPASSV
jgi:hypothetical protein